MASSSPSAILSRYTVISPRNEIEDSSSQLSDEENDFCNDDNTQQCAVYLNQVCIVHVVQDSGHYI